jgi:catechol 2,3-dioxygenase-like lactoylglutathione lyase family enzyme
MLAQETMAAFLSTTDAQRARAFYEGVLGLTYTGDHEHLMTFACGAARLNLQKMDTVDPPQGTALGWTVRDLRGIMQGLQDRGVAFEHYDGMEQDASGVWSPVPGVGVVWFKDPDGNLLSLNGEI